MSNFRVPFLLITAIVVFFASCSSTKSGIALKRKYTKGYYFAFAHNKKNASVSNVNANKLKEEKSYPLVASNEKAAPLPDQKLKSLENIIGNESEKKTSSKSGSKPTIKKPGKSIFSKEQGPATQDQFVVTKDNQPGLLKKSGASQKGGGSTDKLILLILCIFPFINLIAVYLHDNEKITNNFWVTLILNCLIFLPGIIFGFLVVLDIVNLA